MNTMIAPKALVRLRGEVYRRSIDTDLELAYHSRRWSAPAHLKFSNNISSDSLYRYPPRSGQLQGPEKSGKQEHRCESFTSSTTTLTMNAEPAVLPHQKYRHEWMNQLRWQTFLIYHRINFILVAANLLLVIIGWIDSDLKWPKSLNGISIAVAANILLTVIVRNELMVNFLFIIFGYLPQSLPLRVRRMGAKIYHFGGVHSGAAVSSLIWFADFNVAMIRDFAEGTLGNIGDQIFGITLTIDILLITIIATSMPQFRAKYHNTWECIHRYGGWTAVILIWVQFGLLANNTRRQLNPDMGVITMLVTSPVFWLLLMITLCIIWPWLRLRKVKVSAYKLSDHAVQLFFDYTNIGFCVAPRLSDNPLIEWHSFAGIPNESGYGYSVIVSKSGDWTSKMIQHPPTSIWIRSIPVRGVLHIAPIFKSMILVATGSGIGPVLSLLYARKVNCRIVWSTQHPEKTYQAEICRQVKIADPNAVIINTSVTGRPNLVDEAYKLYRELDAEAVFVISNPKVSTTLVYELESRNVPCFAPIFDS